MSIVEKMTTVNYVQLSIPLFFLLIFIEIIYSCKVKRHLYRLSDALTNVATGAIQTMTGLMVVGFTFFTYQFLYDNYRLFELNPSSDLALLGWAALLFIGADFCYYWAHRMSHSLKFMWGGHIVHHQSEEYNLSVALRQGMFQQMMTWPFYLPLAILGFKPVWFIAMNSLVTVYQFWIHTSHIKKLGFLELIFNTPSHHRVHHGVNPEYIDKNHAGVFIIWDKMFGTFVEEKETPTYGTVEPVNTWNPLWANFRYFRDVNRLSKNCASVKDKFLIWFRNPSWTPNGETISVDLQRPKYSTTPGRSKENLAIFGFITTVVVAFLFLTFSKSIAYDMKLIYYGLLLAAFTGIGKLLENRTISERE